MVLWERCLQKGALRVAIRGEVFEEAGDDLSKKRQLEEITRKGC